MTAVDWNFTSTEEVTVILNHVWGVFAHPSEEIFTLRHKRLANTPLYILYLLIFAAIPPIAGYIGATQVGWQIGDGPITKLTVESTIPLCIVGYLCILVGIIAVGMGINWMRETYTELSDKDINGISFTAFVVSPMLLASVVGIYPHIWLGFIALIISACYSLYLLYKLTPLTFQISQERGVLFANAILTFGLVIAVVLIITTVIIWSVAFSPVFTN